MAQSFSFYSCLAAAKAASPLKLFLHWIAAGASVWLETVTTPQRLPPTYAIGLLAAGAILAVWFGSLYQLLVFGYEGVSFFLNHLGGSAALNAVNGSPLTVGLLVCLWARPLAAWFRPGRPAQKSPLAWAYLEPASSPLTLKPQPPLRLDVALAAAGGASLVFVGLMGVLRLGLHLGLPDEVRATVAAREIFMWGNFILALLLQLGAAALVAAVVERVGWAHGLFTAFVAGCGLTLGFVGLVELADCLPILSFGPGSHSCTDLFDPALAQLAFGYLINWGIPLALPVTVAVSALAAWRRRSYRA